MSASVCLSLIVKNEAHVMDRCIDAVKPWISCWCIVDTGSTDGTQELIVDRLSDLPGKLYERPFEGMAKSRNACLELARKQNGCDYILMLDADDVFEAPKDFQWPDLSLDGYNLKLVMGSSSWYRMQLTRAKVPWEYVGAAHEYLTCERAASQGNIEGAQIRCMPDGSRRLREGTKKYDRIAGILERELQEDPHNARNAFYLAQSYRDGGHLQKALEAYESRATMPGWLEETFCTKYEIAKLKRRLGRPQSEVSEAFLSAYAFRPTRIEPLVSLSNYLRERKQWALAYVYASAACRVEKPNDRLFVQEHDYDIGATDELAVAAYRLGRFEEAKILNEKLLARSDLAPQERIRIASNHRFCLQKIGTDMPCKPLTGDLDIERLRERLGDTKVVVSMTTLPSRTDILKKSITSIVNQRFKPDEIFLCLPDESKRQGVKYEMPPWIDEFPSVKVVHCGKDFGPATKLLGSLGEDLPPETIIITFDDDNTYECHVIEKLIEKAIEHPDAAIGFRAWNAERLINGGGLFGGWYEFVYEEWESEIPYVKPVNVLEGCGGVLYRKKFFDDSIMDYTDAPEAAFYVDDVWISGYLALKRIKRYAIPFSIRPIEDHEKENYPRRFVWKPAVYPVSPGGVSRVPEFKNFNQDTATYFASKDPGVWISDVAPIFEGIPNGKEQLKRDRPKAYLRKAAALLGEEPKLIVELGSMRSPLNHPINEDRGACCNDGHSTYVLAEFGHEIISVDISSRATEITKGTCAEFRNVSAVTADGIEFLKNFEGKIDMLYLDAWDAELNNSAQKHLEAYEAARPHLADKHLVLIDDTDINAGGKGRLVSRKLEDLGYQKIFDGRQRLFTNFKLDDEDKKRILDLTYDGFIPGGPGSNSEYTKEYRTFLEDYIRKHGVKSVLDVGCGDWRFSRLIDWGKAHYLGIDLSHRLIMRNRLLYGSDSVEFERADAYACAIPDVDLLIVKDVLQHWSNDKILDFLERVKRSGCKQAMFVNCSYDDHKGINRGIREGQFRPLFLEKTPFDLQADEVFRFHTKSVMLWQR